MILYCFCFAGPRPTFQMPGRRTLRRSVRPKSSNLLIQIRCFKIQCMLDIFLFLALLCAPFRKVQIMELEGAKLICTRSTYVVLKEGEYNVPSVCLKVAESLNCDDEPFVLLDSKNQEIQDCPATQGKYNLELLLLVQSYLPENSCIF